jgi:chromosome partitioning protein
VEVYSFISQKGGTGKSTLARQFAVLSGLSFLIDRDPQQTTAKWWNRRRELSPAPDFPDLIDLNSSTLTAAVDALRRKPDGLTFIDTRPAVDEPVAEAARVSDLVIIPVRPSPDDLEAVGETLRIIRRLNKPAVIVVNAAKTGARALSARAALSRYPVPCCPVHIADRTVYLDAALEGRGVGEMRGHSAQEALGELRKAWEWIQGAARDER